MPQISPMNWLILLVLFIFLFYVVWVKIFYMK